ncbi:SMP-30/gluconolactonase/LRE family protein [Pseudoroseicyclus sp. H15]
MFKQTTGLAAGLLALTAALPSAAQEAEVSWSLDGFSMPESVIYDPDSGTLFVTNINSPAMAADGAGYVSQVSLDGEMLNAEFATGLNSPKGTLISDGMLYVAGIEELAVIDLATGEVTERYSAPGATFLNDVTMGDDGTIYVTETMQSAIYALKDGELTEWLADPALAGANGITFNDGMLEVATMGDLSGGFENLTPSNVKTVNIADMSVSDYGSDAGIGALDGIEAYDGGMLVTDNMGGKLVSVAPDGTVTDLANVGGGAADHEFVADSGMAYVPVMQANELLAIQVE